MDGSVSTDVRPEDPRPSATICFATSGLVYQVANSNASRWCLLCALMPRVCVVGNTRGVVAGTPLSYGSNAYPSLPADWGDCFGSANVLAAAFHSTAITVLLCCSAASSSLYAYVGEPGEATLRLVSNPDQWLRPSTDLASVKCVALSFSGSAPNPHIAVRANIDAPASWVPETASGDIERCSAATLVWMVCSVLSNCCQVHAFGGAGTAMPHLASRSLR